MVSATFLAPVGLRRNPGVQGALLNYLILSYSFESRACVPRPPVCWGVEVNIFLPASFTQPRDYA